MEDHRYLLTHKELAEVLVRHFKIHEGQWAVSVSLGFGPGFFGPSAGDQAPGVVVGVQQIGIQRVAPGAPVPEGLVVDAAQVNPAKSVRAAGTAPAPAPASAPRAKRSASVARKPRS